MQHPYKKYEQDKTWTIVNNLINDLVDNHDIELLTPIEYVVGHICKGLLDSPRGEGKSNATNRG